MTVSGLTIARAWRQPGHRQDRTTQKTLSAFRSNGRGLFRFRTNTCCRRARISVWSAARSAKISMILCMPERVSGGEAKFQGFCDGWNKWEGQATSVPGMSKRLAPRPNLRLRKPLIAASFHLARPTLGTGRNRRHKGRLACRAATPLAARAHPAEIVVVHLDPPRQWHFPLAPGHHRHDLALLGPSRRCLTLRR